MSGIKKVDTSASKYPLHHFHQTPEWPFSTSSGVIIFILIKTAKSGYG